ncbi:MAG: (Fe-S)-binding protein [Acidimicrobiales bacterium]
MRVAVFATCVVDVVAPEVGVAAVRVLRAAGHDVVVPLDQTCCGQPASNAGFTTEAAKVARTTLRALDDALGSGADRAVGLAGSCTSMVRVFWPELFELVGDHAAVEAARRVGGLTDELTEFLAREGLPDGVATRERRPGPRVAYHHSCHMLRELRIKEQPVALLDAAGCERAPWPADERCCGFGGTFSTKLPETSTAMADEKLASLESGVDTVVGADASCLLHLRSRAEHEGQRLRTRHIAEVLADALGAGGAERVDGG